MKIWRHLHIYFAWATNCAIIPSSHYKHLKMIFNLSLLRGSKTVSARQNRTNPLNKKPKSCNFLLFLCSSNINKTNWKRLLFPYPNLFSCGLIAFFNKYNMCVVNLSAIGFAACFALSDSQRSRLSKSIYVLRPQPRTFSSLRISCAPTWSNRIHKISCIFFYKPEFSPIVSNVVSLGRFGFVTFPSHYWMVK